MLAKDTAKSGEAGILACYIGCAQIGLNAQYPCARSANWRRSGHRRAHRSHEWRRQSRRHSCTGEQPRHRRGRPSFQTDRTSESIAKATAEMSADIVLRLQFIGADAGVGALACKGAFSCRGVWDRPSDSSIAGKRRTARQRFVPSSSKTFNDGTATNPKRSTPKPATLPGPITQASTDAPIMCDVIVLGPPQASHRCRCLWHWGKTSCRMRWSPMREEIDRR